MIPARSAHAVETDSPARSSTFEHVPRTATPGFSLPEPLCDGWQDVGLDDILPGQIMHLEHLTEWERQPGAFSSRDFAFDWPDEGNKLPHWSIPHEALRAGDFTRAIPSPSLS